MSDGTIWIEAAVNYHSREQAKVRMYRWMQKFGR
jgi:hypothetical protein